jgi:hypothetical protein
MNKEILKHRFPGSNPGLLQSKPNRIINTLREIKRLYRIIRNMGYGHTLWILNYIANTLGGHKSFISKLPVDKVGHPLPWYTYPAIEYFQQLDFSKCDIFEYGSGNSSKFWSQRAQTITSVESDPNWYESSNNDLCRNQKLFLMTEKPEYINSIHINNCLFDLIIIDGLYRFNCAMEAVKRIKKGGLIILDNSDWWPNTAKLLRDAGFNQIDFIGPGPLNSYAWSTSIYFQDNFDIPRQTKQNVIKVHGGVIQTSEQDRLI